MQFGDATQTARCCKNPLSGRIQFCGHRTVRGAEGQASLFPVLISYCSVPDSKIHHIKNGLGTDLSILKDVFFHVMEALCTFPSAA